MDGRNAFSYGAMGGATPSEVDDEHDSLLQAVIEQSRVDAEQERPAELHQGSKVLVGGGGGGGSSSDGSDSGKQSFNPCVAVASILGICLVSLMVVLAVSTSAFDSYVSRRGDTVSVTETDDMGPKSVDDDGASIIANDTLLFTFYRTGYDVLDQFLPEKSTVLKYKFLSTYDGIVEPYATMHLMPLEFDDYPLYNYKYTVCADAKTDTSVACKHGDLWSDGSETPFAIACSPYETYKIQVTEYYPDDDPVYPGRTRRKSDGAMMCMYVRRELRTLLEADLNDTMSTMAQLWKIDDETGQSKYGSDYHSSQYFVEAHEFNSAQQDSDHMHEGVGFLPQHIKLTNMFEDSMRAVNPAVSVPYWDYTKDRETLDNIFQSSVFSPLIYGSLREPTDSFWGWTYRNDSIEDGRIFDGYWKDIEVGMNTKYKTLKNSYGTVRGLWTVNPSKYISRFPAYSPQLPGCSTYYNWLQISDLGSFFYTANNDPHASTHGAIAAVFGCDALDSMREGGYIRSAASQVELCSQWGFYLKDMYRLNYLWMQSDCTVSTVDKEGIQCGFTCNPDTYDDLPDYLASLFNSNWLSPDMKSSGWYAWRDFICTGDGYRIFYGDHLDPSASPSDPSFWSIHPMQERLMHVKYMTGGFEDDTWPSDSKHDYVCTLAKCYESDVDKYAYQDQCCYGHYETDQLLDWTTGDTSSGFGPTNKQILKNTDPSSRSYSVNYIYDNFDFSHCSDYDFSALVDELYADSLERTDSSSARNRARDRRGLRGGSEDEEED